MGDPFTGGTGTSNGQRLYELALCYKANMLRTLKEALMSSDREEKTSEVVAAARVATRIASRVSWNEYGTATVRMVRSGNIYRVNKDGMREHIGAEKKLNASRISAFSR